MEKVILIPGSGFNELSWGAQLKHLDGVCDCRVYVPNHDTLDEILNDLFSTYYGNVHLVGHSYGGWVAMAAAAKFSDRVKSVISMAHVVRKDEITKVGLESGLKQIKEGKLKEFNSMFKSFCIGDVGPELEKVDKIISKMQSQMTQEQLIRQLSAILADMDISELLPKIKADVLVLYFNGDNFFPTMDEVNFIHDSVKNSKLSVIEDVGHMAPIQASRAISSMIRLWCCN